MEEGQRIFQDDGSRSPLLENTIQLIREYHIRMKHTADFCKRLAECDLFREMQGQFGTRDGSKTFQLSGLYAINEELLLKMEDDKVLDFFRKGEFAWIYCHLTSLSNFPMMVDRFFAPKSEE